MRFRKIRICLKLLRNKLYWNTTDSQKEKILKFWYKKKCGSVLDFNNMTTFNEKIQWLKLFDSTENKTILADKYPAREYVGNTIGKEHLIPVIGVWDRFEDIDFDSLPDKFALKTNHGSGWNTIVTDKSKMDYDAEKKRFDTWLKLNFATEYGYELHYMNIKPKIIAEKYMENFTGNIYDYRFFCFDGNPKYVWLDCGSGTNHHTRSIFDSEWNLQDYLVNYPPLDTIPDKPSTFDSMYEYAKLLSKGFAFVRIDFYSIDDFVYFGEMTFTPQSGTGKWDSYEQNKHYGSLLNIPEKKPIPKKIRF